MAHTSKEGIQQYWEATGKIQVTAAELDAPSDLSVLGQSAMDMVNAATATALPTDARIGSDPYSVIISSISQISVGSASAEDVLNEALSLFQELDAQQ